MDKSVTSLSTLKEFESPSSYDLFSLTILELSSASKLIENEYY